MAAALAGGRQGAAALALLGLLLALVSNPALGFNPTPLHTRGSQQQPNRPLTRVQAEQQEAEAAAMVGRAGAVLGQVGGALAALGALGGLASVPLAAGAAGDPKQKLEYMPGIEGRGYGKPRQVYKDFVQTPSGLQYKDVRDGKGDFPRVGDRVVIDWEGYTIGYYGRIFEAKGKTKGGAFDAADKEYLRFVLGKQPMIPALEEAVATMKPGGIRQVVVPPELGYPADDPEHDRVGPKPSTFSGQRALDFVLKNQGLVDKTLLINVELKRVDKPGERGFKG